MSGDRSSAGKLFQTNWSIDSETSLLVSLLHLSSVFTSTRIQCERRIRTSSSELSKMYVWAANIRVCGAYINYDVQWPPGFWHSIEPYYRTDAFSSFATFTSAKVQVMRSRQFVIRSFCLFVCGITAKVISRFH